MPDQKSSKASDYVVGYRRPPKASQFIAGKSGNPRGRPKGSRSCLTQPRLVQGTGLKMMVSVIWNGMGIPLIWTLLPKAANHCRSRQLSNVAAGHPKTELSINTTADHFARQS
jgi:Family of unknown function (DUF5681)